MAKDYYSILGVQKNASQEEIKKAFRQKAHQYHPDKKGGDEARFKEANEAYQVLGDETKRKQYDQFGSTFDQAGFGGGGGYGGFNWQDFTRQYGNFSGGAGPASGWDFGDLGDIFGDMFGFGSGRKSSSRRSTRGQDINAEISIEFKESVFGGEKTVELDKEVVCQKCGGSGAEPGSKVSTCPTCGGSGQVEQVQRTILGAMRTIGVCPDCRGEGKKVDKPCGRCHGRGIYKDREVIKIKIPAGISDGQTIRLSGKGEAGERGTAPGDLYLTVLVKPHALFKREGDDILTKANITFRQAALGDKIEVETVHGPVILKIPDGTQTGRVFKLKEKGVPHLNSSGAGDHLVEVVVTTPTRLSRSQKKALEELE
jgi:molecular chaperone DnaJ